MEITYSLLLGRGLLLGSRFLLRRSLLLGSRLLLRRGLLRRRLLGLGGGSGLLLVVGTDLVGGLDLDEVSLGNHLLQGAQEGSVEPLLVGREIGLHVLLDGDRGGAGAVLELRDGGDDSCFVRHG